MKQKWLKNSILLICLLFVCISSTSSFATTYRVGPSHIYPTPRALDLANVIHAGDTIEIEFNTYIGQDALAVWDKDNLYLVGVNGKPHMKANGSYILGKGIWVCTGNNITVDNIEFSEASVPDENGAGIRLDGIGLTVKNCYFHDNENGILTNNTYDGKISILHCEFNYNGFGDGYTHNLYIGHCDTLVFMYNYSHHAKVGHNLKTRADYNFIQYNRIMDEATGNSSRLIDIPNGGTAYLIGNICMQGPNALNNNLIGYGLEGLTNLANHEFYCINNTFVNKRTASCIFVSIQSGTTIAEVSNNIFSGTGTILNGTTTGFQNNVIHPIISDTKFTNETNYDYSLTATSPAIDFGTTLASVNNTSLTPDKQYIHPLQFANRITSNLMDAGAYEYQTTTHLPFEVEQMAIRCFPNPSIDIIFIENISTADLVRCFNLKGEEFAIQRQENVISIEHLKKGFYLFQVFKNNKTYPIPFEKI